MISYTQDCLPPPHLFCLMVFPTALLLHRGKGRHHKLRGGLHMTAGIKECLWEGGTKRRSLAMRRRRHIAYPPSPLSPLPSHTDPQHFSVAGQVEAPQPRVGIPVPPGPVPERGGGRGGICG